MKSEKGKGLGAFFQQCLTAFEDVTPGGFEVAGVPWVCHIAGTAGEIHEFVNFMIGVASADGPHISDVPFVHPDEKVKAFVVSASELAGSLASTADAVCCQLASGWRINAVAQLLCGGGGRFYVEVGLAVRLLHQVFHHELCHGTAADVAVADKENTRYFLVIHSAECKFIAAFLTIARWYAYPLEEDRLPYIPNTCRRATLSE